MLGDGPWEVGPGRWALGGRPCRPGRSAMQSASYPSCSSRVVAANLPRAFEAAGLALAP